MASPVGAFTSAVAGSAAQGQQAIDQAGSVGRAARSPQDRVSARKLVLVSTALLLAINVYRSRDPEAGGLYRRLWGTGVFGVMLAVAADFAPEVAGPFALLVALGAYTKRGQEFQQALLGKISNGVPAGADVNPSTNPRALGPPAPAIANPSGRAGIQGGSQ